MSNNKHCQWGWGLVSKLLPKWLLKKIEWKGCENDLIILPGKEVNYCSKHGCSFCCYKNHVETKVGDTNKECCRSCKTEAERLLTKVNNEMKAKKLCWEVDDKANDLSAKLKNIHLPFYENTKKAKEELDNLKKKIFNKEITLDNNQHSIIIVNIINKCSFLKESEKTKWKKIYENVSPETDKLIKLLSPEQNLLISLAQITIKERERERAKLLTEEIKAELNNSPLVNITELDNKWHNYESLAVAELERVKNDIIEAIKNKRAVKKLTDLLNRANDCPNNDLWTFIQELEKFVSASSSPYEKIAYSARQNEVDTTLNKIRSRWNNLSEEAKLINYWNNASQNFDNWLKEANSLQLAAERRYQKRKKSSCNRQPRKRSLSTYFNQV